MKRTLSAALVAMSLSGIAHAAFYVDDDAPIQTAAESQPTSRQVTLDLAFIPKHAWMTTGARSQLAASAATIRSAEQISVIVGTAKPAYPLLVKQRVVAIKQWLAANGVDGQVEVVEDSTPRTKEFVDVITVDMTVHTTPRAAALTAARAAMATYAPPPRRAAVQVMVAAPQPLINDQTKLALLQRIVLMGKNKIVKPDEAFALIAEVLDMRDLAPAQPVISTAPTTITASPIVAQLIAPEVSRQWSLDPTKSLHANLDDWARIAGWEAPVWDVSNPYQVGAANLTGTFYEALGQIANAVPNLDFTINKQRRSMRITEAVR